MTIKEYFREEIYKDKPGFDEDKEEQFYVDKLIASHRRLKGNKIAWFNSAIILSNKLQHHLLMIEI